MEEGQTLVCLLSCWCANGNERHQAPNLCRALGEDALAFGQYEQGGCLGSPDLSPAGLLTRDHRGAGCALPRPALSQWVLLGSKIRTTVLLSSLADRECVRLTPIREPDHTTAHYENKAFAGKFARLPSRWCARVPCRWSSPCRCVARRNRALRGAPGTYQRGRCASWQGLLHPRAGSLHPHGQIDGDPCWRGILQSCALSIVRPTARPIAITVEPGSWT